MYFLTSEPILMIFGSTFDGTGLLGKDLIRALRSRTSDVSEIILTRFRPLSGERSMVEIPIWRGAPISSVRHRSAFSVGPEMIGEELLISVQRIGFESLVVKQFLSEDQREGPIVVHFECPHATHDGSLEVHGEREID